MSAIAQLTGLPQPSAKQTFNHFLTFPGHSIPKIAAIFHDYKVPELPEDVTFVQIPGTSNFKAVNSKVYAASLEDFSKNAVSEVVNKSFSKDYVKAVKDNNEAVIQNKSIKSKPIPLSLIEALQQVTETGQLPPKPAEPLSDNVRVGLDHVLALLNKHLPVAPTDTMAGRLPSLSTANLPQASTQEASATASPARGTAMLNNIFKSVRVPEFRFKWQFWAEKGQQATPANKTAGAEEYASRPKPLGDQIISVKEFYQHFNNIPVGDLKLRDSIHLFHLGVKPLWEDPRNARGGAYYFRISKDLAPDFWHEICLLAVGDILQGAVETKRPSFNDDICGISYSVRWNAVQIAIWTRDADNEAGKAKLLATVLDKLSERLQPKKDAYWYKAHREHKGFAAPSS